MSRWPAALLFDMDGTLLDSEHLWLRAEELTMASLGAAWSAQDQANCLGGPLERVVDYMITRAGVADEVTHEQLSEQLLHTIEWLFRTSPIDWRPGALDLLSQAHALGLPSALVTASWRRLISIVETGLIEELGVNPFTVMVGGDEVSESKPSPVPYLHAATMLGVDIADCLVIEDSPTGIAAGVASGAFVLAVPHIAQPPELPGLLIRRTLAGTSIEQLWSECRDQASGSN